MWDIIFKAPWSNKYILDTLLLKKKSLQLTMFPFELSLKMIVQPNEIRTARRSNQSILNEINPEYPLEGLKLKLKLQYLVTWCEEPLMQGKIEGRRRSGRQRMRCLGGITNSVDVNFSELQETVKDREAWRAAVHGVRVRHNWATEQQQQEWNLVSLFLKTD